MSLEEFGLALGRHAFSPRDAARAGDLWRAFQDAALLGSSRRGWDPPRYRREGYAFVVRAMTVVHHAEVPSGPPLHARTWVSSFQRGMFTNRQIRLTVHGRPLASATQRWVFVAMPDLRPARAPEELVAAFELHELEPDVALPEVAEPREGSSHRFGFDVWHTWMDPLDHANHPAYVDWIDEALSRRLVAAGVPAEQLRAVGESVTYRAGVPAGARVEVTSKLAGITATGACVIEHRIGGPDEQVYAEATSVRTLVDAPERLVDALG